MVAPWLPWQNDMVNFLATVISNLWRDSCYGSTIGHNVFIWQNYGLQSSAIDNTEYNSLIHEPEHRSGYKERHIPNNGTMKEKPRMKCTKS